MSKGRTLSWLATCLSVPAASSRAWALCPNCLAQQSVLTPTLKLLGLFLVVPFVVAAGVYLVVRRTSYGGARLVVVASPAAPPPSSPAPPSSPPSRDGGVQTG